MTTTYPGVVKAWHKHEQQTDNIACVVGMIKVALYDGREGSPTHGEVNQFYLGVHKPALLQVPAGIHHGWMCVSQEEAVIVNVPTEPYDHDASRRTAPRPVRQRDPLRLETRQGRLRA